jgi:hypothetical protein
LHGPFLGEILVVPRVLLWTAFDLFILLNVRAVRNWARILFLALFVHLKILVASPTLMLSALWISWGFSMYGPMETFQALAILATLGDLLVRVMLAWHLINPDVRAFFTTQPPNRYERTLLIPLAIVSFLLGLCLAFGVWNVEW